MRSGSNPALSEYKLFYDVLTGQDSVALEKLQADTGSCGVRYRELLAGLNQIASFSNRAEINRALIGFLKNMIHCVFKDHQIRRLSVEVCVAGSLARNYATPYSDIDCFMIYSDDLTSQERRNLQIVAQKIFAIADKLFLKTQQFCMDPIGISISKLSGTINELLKKIEDFESDEPGPVTMSICVARSVFGDSVLLERLQERIKVTRNLSPHMNFDLVLDEKRGYIGPKDSKKLFIKRDLIRPLDFILQGMREDAKLSLQEFDDPAKLIQVLQKQKKITPITGTMMVYLFEAIYELRRLLHDAQKREHDEIQDPPENVKKLILMVGLVRGALKSYLTTGILEVSSANYLSSNQTYADLSVEDQKQINSICKEFLYKLEHPVLGVTHARLFDDKKASQEDVVGILEKMTGNVRFSNDELIRIYPILKSYKSWIFSEVTAEDFSQFVGLNLSDEKVREPFLVADYLEKHGLQGIAKACKHASITTFGMLKRLQDNLKLIDFALLEKIKKIRGNSQNIFLNISAVLNILVHDQKAIDHSSSQIALMSRILNCFPSPTIDVSIETAAESLRELVEPILVAQAHSEAGESKAQRHINFALNSWLHEVLIKHVFPQLLETNGMIKDKIWDLLYLDQIFDRQDNLLPAQLEELTKGLIQSYVVNIVSTFPPIQAVQLELNCANLVSRALNGLLADPKVLDIAMKDFVSRAETRRRSSESKIA
jgi:predicted nucleotidyltransferase